MSPRGITLRRGRSLASDSWLPYLVAKLIADFSVLLTVRDTDSLPLYLLLLVSSGFISILRETNFSTLRTSPRNPGPAHLGLEVFAVSPSSSTASRFLHLAS